MEEHEQRRRDPVEAEQRDVDVQDRQRHRGRTQELLVRRGADDDREIENVGQEKEKDVRAGVL